MGNPVNLSGTPMLVYPVGQDANGNNIAIPMGTPTSPTTSAGFRETIDLVSNSNAAGTSASQIVYGGDYAFSITGTIGTSVQLQTLNRDGTTYTNYLAARTTNDGAATPPGATLATFGGAATVRAVVTGTPTALYVSLTRIPA